MKLSKETLRWIVQILASVLTALATALGTASCVHALTASPPML